MTEVSPRLQEIFFEVYEALPRQGPGNRASAEVAFRLCRDLPPAPTVLDLGCGVGAQTLYLAEFNPGNIVAIDSHAPSVAQEPEMHRRHSDCYAYEFFVARRVEGVDPASVPARHFASR